MQAGFRHYTFLDKLIIEIDRAISTVHGLPRAHSRARPDQHLELDGPELTASEQQQVGRLLRVDHCGEVCAQALYNGQRVFARDEAVAERLAQSAEEETDHLAWCEQRLQELASRPSYLGPLWYVGSYGIGLAAGAMGDPISLGFVVETEKQVEAHLASHLEQLPANDYKSRTILQQMLQDEVEHADAAEQAGAQALPGPIKIIMKFTAKIMTSLSYWI